MLVAATLLGGEPGTAPVGWTISMQLLNAFVARNQLSLCRTAVA